MIPIGDWWIPSTKCASFACHWIPVLHEWQDLAAGMLGAAAVTLTVAWTLFSERRRRRAEGNAVRTALAAEIRQFAARAIDVHVKVRAMLAGVPRDLDFVRVNAQQLEDTARFPNPVVYPHTASSLGLLRDRAYAVVHFYGQIELIREVLRRDADTRDPGQPLPRAHLQNLAEGLLKGAEAAVRVFPAFEKNEADQAFASLVLRTREAFDASPDKPPKLNPAGV